MAEITLKGMDFLLQIFQLCKVDFTKLEGKTPCLMRNFVKLTLQNGPPMTLKKRERTLFPRRKHAVFSESN